MRHSGIMFAKLVIATIGLGVAVGLMMPAPSVPPVVASSAPPSTPKPTPAASVDTVLNRADNGHFYVDAEINGQLVHFVVDTGATTIALTKADALHAGLSFSPEKFEVIGRGVSGDVRGEAIRIGRVAIDQKQAYDVEAVVLDDGLDVSLLGQSFLSRIGTVVIDGDRMILR